MNGIINWKTKLSLAASLLLLSADEEKQNNFAEDPTQINKNTKSLDNKKLWVGKSPEEIREYVRENLHLKLRAKKVIDDSKHPEWQWFRKSGLGIFFHWGLASTIENKGDAWGMVWNEGRNKTNRLKLPEDMFASAETWNPENYNPHKWMKAASNAGFGYAVLTTRHHDGYCLWPSEHGTWDTGDKMEGRDLVKQYVDACRDNDIKVGFYFSGPNWHFAYKQKDFSWPPSGYNYKHEKVEADPPLAGIMGYNPPLPGDLDAQEEAESIEQVKELLTNYGDVDIFWWDGNILMTDEEIHKIQPKTFVARGNIATPEGLKQGASHNVKMTNEAGWWWEMCAKTELEHTPYWHYNEIFETEHWDTNRLLTELIRCRSLGGNLLANITPRPNGEMMDWYYRFCAEMKEWMDHSREAIYDVKLTPPLPMLDLTENYTTVKGNVWYSLPNEERLITLNDVGEIASVTLLRTGQKLDYNLKDGTFSLELPAELTTSLPDMVKIVFK